MGLAVSADLSGVSLAGGLLKTDGRTASVGYVGMLLGRFGIYGLSVFGGYTDDNGSPSFFVFGAVNGPIGGPPAFFVTGIGGGLGINRGAASSPSDLSRFDDFPFIKALDPAAQPSGDLMAELRALNLYFPPERGNFWFAAGISFNCFALVDGIAVVAVSFGDGFELNLLRPGPHGAAPAAGGAGVDRARAARPLLDHRGPVPDPGPADRQLVAAVRRGAADRRLRLRDLVEGRRSPASSCSPSAATTRASTATATRSCRGSGSTGGSATTS